MTTIWICIALLPDILKVANNVSSCVSSCCGTSCYGNVSGVNRWTLVMLTWRISWILIIRAIWSKSAPQWLNSFIVCLSNNVLDALVRLIVGVARLLPVLLSFSEWKCLILDRIVIFCKHSNARWASRLVRLSNTVWLVLMTHIVLWFVSDRFCRRFFNHHWSVGPSSDRSRRAIGSIIRATLAF